MSITGSLTQISASLLEKVKETPSSLDVFWRVSPIDDKEPKIDNIQGLSSEHLAMLHEILSNPEEVVNQWTLQDIRTLEYWKADYSADYKHLRADVYRLVTEGKTTPSIDLFQDWHLLSYIFRNDTSMEVQPFLVAEEGEDLRVNAVLCGQPIDEVTRYLETEQVQTVTEGLLRISETTIKHRIQQGATLQAKLYSFWAEEDYEELLEFCKVVKEFYSDAANRGNAVLIQII
jgi:hypothetical protein